MSCYAYKDENVTHLFKDHLLGALEILRTRLQDELITFSKVVSARLDIDANEARELVEFAVLTHDLGKIQYEFQEECQKSACKGFPYHYVISARILYKALSQVTEKEIYKNDFVEELLRNPSLNDFTHKFILLVIIPVLLHHYAQLEAEGSIYNIYNSKLRVWRSCINDVELIINSVNWGTGYIESIGRSLIEVLKKYENEGIIMRTPFEDRGIISSKISTTPLTRFLIDSVIGLVNMADGIDAVRVRRYRRMDHIRC